jgi:hypothetical protein
MSQSLRIFLGFTSILAFAACSGGGGGGNGGAGNTPQNKEQALNQLSAKHKANFESWQKKVVKACDASQAFGLNSDRQPEDGVDGAALISNNNGSVIFSDGNSFAIMSGSSSFAGIGNTKAEETSNSYTVTAETKREGSSCVVYLYGQKVYETSIYQSFTVGLQYSPNTQATATSSIPVVKNIGLGGASEVVQHGLYSLLTQSLKPTKDSQTFIAQRLGLNVDQATKLFKLSDSSIGNSIVKLESDQNSVWSSNEFGNLIASTSTLKKSFDGSNRAVQLEVRLRVPQYEIGGVKNSSDQGNLKLSLTANIVKKDNGFTYTLNSMQNAGLVPFSADEAIACAGDRLSVYLGTENQNMISPSVQTVMNPCSILYAQVEDTAYQKGFYKSAVSTVLAGVSPSSQIQYGGWDYVLSKLAKDALAANKDIVSELDPSGKTKIVSMISRHLTTLKSEIEKSKNMLTVKDTVLNMGLDWSFQGQNVSGGRVTQIIQSIDNSTDVFSVSSSRLLNDLARNPNSNDDQLSFARNIDNAYKSEAQKALGLSKDLNYSNFETDIFNKVIQRKTTIDEIRDWSSKLTTVKTEVNKYPSLSSVKVEVVGLSIKWLKSGEVTEQDLGSVYSALNNAVEPFTESTKQLIRDLGQSLGANKEALEFSRNLTAEYKQLAILIRSNATAAENESWGTSFFNSVLQKRPAIGLLRQWNELWTSALAFIQREKAKVAGELGSSPEWNRKKVIEVALKEVWSAQDFSALEAISQVAKAKNTCDRHKDASSLADCAGMSLFSKGQKKFFDPAYSGRYSGLGADFTNYMNQLGGFDWTSLRWALIGEFFGSWEPIWSKCDGSSFSQKAATLKSQINAIINEGDQFKKWELERQIKETIKNCQ